MTTLIETIHGPLAEELLEKRLGSLENEVESTHWVEYWLAGELVHRSVHVHLKLGTECTVTGNIFA